MPDDHELLIAWTERRDEAAFTALARRYVGLVHGTCRRRLGDSEADDATQAVFLVLLRKAPELVRRPRPLGAWLFAVAARVAANAARGRQRRRHHEQVAAMDMPVTADPGGDWNEVRPHLDAVLDDLPARYREPLILHYLHGLDRRATAASLGMNEEAVKKRLQRGLERARALLARRGVAIGAGVLGSMLAGRADTAAPTAILDHLATLPHAAPAPAVATLAAGGSPMAIPATLLAPVALTLGAVIAGIASMLPQPPARSEPAEQAPPDPLALAAAPTWPDASRGCWYLSLLDWRFERDQYSPPGLDEIVPGRMVEACLIRGDFVPGEAGGFTCHPVLVWREMDGDQEVAATEGTLTLNQRRAGLILTSVFRPGMRITPSTLGLHRVRLRVDGNRCDPIGYVADLEHDYGTVLTGLGVPDLVWPLPPVIPAVEAPVRLPSGAGTWTVTAPAFRQPTFAYAGDWHRSLPRFLQTRTEVLSVPMQVTLDAEAEGPVAGRMVWDPATSLPAASECRAVVALRLVPALLQPAPQQPAAAAIHGTLTVHRRAWVLAPTGDRDWVEEVAAMAALASTAVGPDAVPTPDWRALVQGADPVLARMATRILAAAEHPPTLTREAEPPEPPAPTEPTRDF